MKPSLRTHAPDLVVGHLRTWGTSTWVTKTSSPPEFSDFYFILFYIKQEYQDPTWRNTYHARSGPYDRNHKPTWREKQVVSMEQRVSYPSSHEVVPYEQHSDTTDKAPTSSNQQRDVRTEPSNITKRLASTIVTPSQVDQAMEENVTKRDKVLT